MYYTEKCGSCQKLAPIWDELGLSTAGIEDLVIAKMNYLENEVDGLDLNQFPSIKLYRQKKKSKVKTYKGPMRSVGYFTSWLKEVSPVYQEAIGAGKKTQKVASEEASTATAPQDESQEHQEAEAVADEAMTDEETEVK